MQEHVPRFSTLPQAARVIWAKSGEDLGHSLLGHMLDVAAVAETILEKESPSTSRWAAEVFGLPPEAVRRWIAAIAGLHDFGKAIPGFQAKWAVGMKHDQSAGLDFNSRACRVTDHSCATAALLKDALNDVTDLELDWRRHVVQAVSAHHGYHFSSSEVRKARPTYEVPSWNEVRQIILKSYWAVLSPIGSPNLDALTTPAVNWLAGLTSVADWIASNPEWFPLGERCDELHAYYAHAHRLGLEALKHIGWSSGHTLLTGLAATDELLGRIVGRAHALPARPLQRVGDRLLRSINGPVLLLVEAPMGEGKTELAFLAHLRLQAANHHRGFYIALPTQATGNAMFKRATTFLHAFSAERMDVQLVHGGAAMNDEVRHLHDINQSPNESLAASVWFSQRRRPLLSPYGVGTVDQALLAALNVKHHFVRLWGLSNRVVVLDEVHAYDTYTSGLIESLLHWLKALGSSVVLMSATLPQSRRDTLLRAWGVKSDQVPELPYPRVLLVDDRGLRGESFSARSLPSIRLAHLAEGVDALAERARQLLANGGCGVVIVNTVDRAQKLYALLRESLERSTQLLLFHARFPADQRSEREKKIIDLFGPDGKRPAEALLIATQVVEQSLDLDFDFMISDLAPVDLLLQRAGRLHRHSRQRPSGHTQATLHVAGLQPERLPALKETAWSFVYDPYILGRTWALLSREVQLQLPGDIDRLVQAVYGDEHALPNDLDASARDFIEGEAYGAYLGKCQMERMMAIDVAIDPRREPQYAYADKHRGYEIEDGPRDDLGLPNVTRIGEESVTVIPIVETNSGWLVRSNGPTFDPSRPVADVTARQLYQRHLKLSQKAVVRHFRSSEPVAAFVNHALLRSFYPLPLRDGLYQRDGLRLRLDEELGLVLGKEGE